MAFNELRDGIILGEMIFFYFLFAFVLIHQLILGLELFGASTIVTWEPFDIRSKVLVIVYDLLVVIGIDMLKLSGFGILQQFVHSNYRSVVEIEYSIYLDPLKPNKVIIAA